MDDQHKLMQLLDQRNREIFSRLVESYLANGNPIGSRTLSREISNRLSAATIRNIMHDLEHFGLLESPHVSAGRVPTEYGLRMFVDELLEIGEIGSNDRDQIDILRQRGSSDITKVLDQVSSLLSNLTKSASLVLAPKQHAPIKHVEFVSLAPDRALVVLVTSDGAVENRIFEPPSGQTPAAMKEAANYVNSISQGKTVAELRNVISKEISERKTKLDEVATDLVNRGIAVCQVVDNGSERLIVKGRSNLLAGSDQLADLDRVRDLFDELDRKRDIARFLEMVEEGEGVKVFIGSENKLFSLTGSTLVAAPYMDSGGKIVGAVGVIGPTRLNYGRIVPIVDYTAQLVGSMMDTTTK